MKNKGAPPFCRQLFILTLSFAFFTSSCGWFKPARDSEKEKVYTEDDMGELQGTRVFDPETGEWRTVREVSGKLDTVQWKLLNEKDFPPIVTDENWSGGGATTGGNTGGGVVPGTLHEVAIALPFLAGKSGSGEIDPNSQWAIQFYAGAKLAYESLSASGVSLHITVSDTEGSTNVTRKLVQDKQFQSAEMIIGPYKRDNVKILEGFAAKNRKSLIVPYTASSGMAEDNPFYIQANPSLKSHCAAITRHARKGHKTENIVLVSRDKPEEKERFAMFQEANAAIEGTSTGSKFRELVVKESQQDEGIVEIDVKPYLAPGETTVFIVPSWSSESFVYALLRQLIIAQTAGEESGEQIIVYGMPQWMDFEQVDYEFYRKLNVHVSSAFYLNAEDERVRQFRQKYFDTYHTVPMEEAFLGYDIMLYFGRMIHKYGKDFYRYLDSEPYDVLHGRFEFSKVVLEPAKHREQLDYYDQLENSFVHILQFRDYQFQSAE